MNNHDVGTLVSIIVRTKDRPKLLKRALESISAQTYRPIEVVLVNDGGCDLPEEELREILGDASLNYVRLQKNRGRAGAGNAGIENANGDYIGFLDDDDEFYPEHLSVLASCLKQTDFRVAYTDAEISYRYLKQEERKIVDVGKTILSSHKHFVQEEGKTADLNRHILFSEDFSYEELLVGNYIPFMCLLFVREALTDSGGFDSNFILYEDWEFLVRIAEKYPFYHIKKTTAIYNQWNSDSQINQADPEQMRAMYLKVINKHREKIQPEFIMDLWLRSKEKDTRLEAVLKERDISIDERNSLISNLKNVLLESDAHIAYLKKSINLIDSTLGWKVLKKFRGFRERVLPQNTGLRRFYDFLVKSFRNAYQQQDNREPSEEKDPYQLWISKNEPDFTALEVQKKLSGEFKYRPKISVITPVYNTDKNVLKMTIESVINQTYDNWELCLADGASSRPFIRGIIQSYCDKDRRIKARFLELNKGISGNSNEALSMATGEFIALLDHDDSLAPFALFEVVKAINESPEVDFIYTDRDMITLGEKRFGPFFKPGWSPDYLLSCNYLCHLNVFRKTIIDRIGGFRKAFDGSQDYDLVLRVTELTDKIIHIPKVLYHWRAVTGSAADSSSAKPYAYKTAVNALQEAINRRGYEGVVERGVAKGFYNVKLKINSNPKVSVITHTRDNVDILSRCVGSILNKTTYNNYEVVIVDNQSRGEETSNYYQALKRYPRVKVLEYNKPFNFSDINNFAVSKTESEYLVFLNSHTELLTRDWIQLMLGFAQRKETGAVGVKLIYPTETMQHAGLAVGITRYLRRSHHAFPRNSLGHGGQTMAIQNLSVISAACMMMRRNVFEEIGGFDSGFAVAHGDIDLCFRIRNKNYLIVYLPAVELYHHESYLWGREDVSEKIEQFIRENELLMKKWGYILKKGDPYYNHNLKFDIKNFPMNI